MWTVVKLPRCLHFLPSRSCEAVLNPVTQQCLAITYNSRVQNRNNNDRGQQKHATITKTHQTFSSLQRRISQKALRRDDTVPGSKKLCKHNLSSAECSRVTQLTVQFCIVLFFLFLETFQVVFSAYLPLQASLHVTATCCRTWIHRH